MLTLGAGVVVGILGGALLRFAALTPEHIDLLGFAGEIMLRLLKMLVLPLVAGSMVAGGWWPPHALSVWAPSAVQHWPCLLGPVCRHLYKSPLHRLPTKRLAPQASRRLLLLSCASHPHVQRATGQLAGERLVNGTLMLEGVQPA